MNRREEGEVGVGSVGCLAAAPDECRSVREEGEEGGEEADDVEAEEAAEATIKVKLRTANGKQQVQMSVVPSATFASLLKRYCDEHGEGSLTPSMLNMEFDGEKLDLTQTPAQLEIEDDDIIEITRK